MGTRATFRKKKRKRQESIIRRKHQGGKGENFFGEKDPLDIYAALKKELR